MMSVGIALRYRDGVLLATDSQVVEGKAKIGKISKIISIRDNFQIGWCGGVKEVQDQIHHLRRNLYLADDILEKYLQESLHESKSLEAFTPEELGKVMGNAREITIVKDDLENIRILHKGVVYLTDPVIEGEYHLKYQFDGKRAFIAVPSIFELLQQVVIKHKEEKNKTYHKEILGIGHDLGGFHVGYMAGDKSYISVENYAAIGSSGGYAASRCHLLYEQNLSREDAFAIAFLSLKDANHFDTGVNNNFHASFIEGDGKAVVLDPDEKEEIFNRAERLEQKIRGCLKTET